MERKRKFTVVFRCSVPKCSYTSKRLYNLQRHTKTHKKEHWRSKRFPCPCCAYAAATRAHLKRHMGIKHPTEDINSYDLTGLAYEDFAEQKPDDVDEEEEEEVLADEEMEEEQQSLKQEEENEMVEIQEEFIEEDYMGPVTVLQMVSPQSEMYCNVSVEGEAFRLIPVALIPAEDAEQQL